MTTTEALAVTRAALERIYDNEGYSTTQSNSAIAGEALRAIEDVDVIEGRDGFDDAFNLGVEAEPVATAITNDPTTVKKSIQRKPITDKHGRDIEMSTSYDYSQGILEAEEG